MLKPQLSSIIYHTKSILVAWFVSAVMFSVLALAAFLMQGALGVAFTLEALSNWLTLLLMTNAVAISLIVVSSFAVSILAFKKGLDPSNFVDPIENAFAASITTVALLAALAILSLVVLV
jgi:cation transporter-like permease